MWQCRRTAEICDRLKADGLEETVTEKTGLLIDAYFSGTKLKWIMDHVPGVRQRAERGELCAGTVDSWLIWNLTGGKAHVTDYSNATRTMLFNIHTLQWDEDLCAALRVPMSLLPSPRSNSETYGVIAPELPGLETLAGIPICGSAGDQPAALFGQGCFTPGQAKNTYGTGCFTLMNVGDTPVRSRAGLVTSVGWQVAGKTVYALEGSVFNAGSTIQWLRDELGLIESAPGVRPAGGERAGRRRRGGGACLHRSGRALLGYVRPGHHRGTDPGQHQGAYCPGGAGVPSPSRSPIWCGP